VTNYEIQPRTAAIRYIENRKLGADTSTHATASQGGEWQSQYEILTVSLPDRADYSATCSRYLEDALDVRQAIGSNTVFIKFVISSSASPYPPSSLQNTDYTSPTCSTIEKAVSSCCEYLGKQTNRNATTSAPAASNVRAVLRDQNHRGRQRWPQLALRTSKR